MHSSCFSLRKKNSSKALISDKKKKKKGEMKNDKKKNRLIGEDQNLGIARGASSLGWLSFQTVAFWTLCHFLKFWRKPMISNSTSLLQWSFSVDCFFCVNEWKTCQLSASFHELSWNFPQSFGDRCVLSSLEEKIYNASCEDHWR